MADFPKHSNSIDLVDLVFCFYEYKYPIFCGQFSVPNILNPVNGTVNYRFKSGTNMVILTRVGDFGYRDLQHKLS